MKSFFLGKVKQVGVISIISIVVLSYGLFFYVQGITENNVRSSLFEQQKDLQLESVRSISRNIESDINRVMLMLDGLAGSFYFQQGELYSEATKKLMEEKYQQFSTTVDRLFVLDKKDIVTLSITQRGSETFVGNDLSLREWVSESKNRLEPVFSNGFERQGIYTIFITHPIVNRDSKEYIGMVVTSIPTVKFFSHYGNVKDSGTPFLVAYDKNGIILANGANEDLVGESFFEPAVQNFIEQDKTLNNLTRSLLSGYSGHGVYDYGRGERLTTQSAISIDREPIFSIQLVTPSAQIYAQINQVLFTERMKMFSLLAGTSAAVVVLIVFIIKWSSSLDREVKRRTTELKESNERLALANEQLKLQEKMQKEFINVAAHELRTPIQPILGLSEILRSRLTKAPGWQGQDLLDIIIRNAKRLQRLAEDILDVTRIESQSLRLKKERFNLNQMVSNIIEDHRNQILKDNTETKTEDTNTGINLILLPGKDDIEVEADKSRIAQVISNLLSNAIKFTRQERIEAEKESSKDNQGKTILITVEKDGVRKEAVVSIQDAGIGIDSEIFPRLFSKFASKSFEGTGLGLFISRSIVEAHGGKIWAENNSGDSFEEGGATFRFSLALSDVRHEDIHATIDN
ncbi:MAG TPA: sensor histidine kinase [Nitrososphaeraceae archaeon]|nr:sensor histidine kinase [Nitrososphaeraceae archaeon]